MQRLLDGIHHFQNKVFGTQQQLFERLAGGQEPTVLFVTCSDSRINPNLVTQTNPGELFILRNVGNIIPPYGAASRSGEAAAIEYAISVLNVQDVIVCGHSHCGAMNGLLNLDKCRDLPAVTSWLAHAESTRMIIRENYRDRSPDDLPTLTVQENVLVQLENLRTHPAVAARLASGKLKLHGWFYKLETGEVLAFSPEYGQFASVAPGSHPDDDDVPDIIKRK